MLRDYQLRIKSALESAWARTASVMVQMPTGTGKTHVLASVIGDELSERGDRVWVVAHRRELVEQIVSTGLRYGLGMAGDRVRVMSVQWLSRHWDDVADSRPTLIVVDEAHHAPAPGYRELWLRCPDARKLGMTATPWRLDGRGFTDLFGRLVVSEGIASFIRRGWLSAFDYAAVVPDSAEGRRVLGLKCRGADGDYLPAEMEAVLDRGPSVRRLVASVRRFAEGRKGIVYAVSVAHARHIAACYRSFGLRAAAVDGGTPAAERRRLVEDFRCGRLQVLVNVDVFSEGFDCPDAEFVQLARPTLSLAKYLQQAGRGLRRSLGKEGCVLIDHAGLCRRFGLPTRERDWQAAFEGRAEGTGLPGRTAETIVLRGGGAGGRWAMPDAAVRGGAGVSVPEDAVAVKSGTGVFVPEDKGAGSAGFSAAAEDDDAGDAGDMELVITREKLTECLRSGAALPDPAVPCGTLLPDHIAMTRLPDGRLRYTDMLSGRQYTERPSAVRLGQVEMLRSGGRWYSRTRHVYESSDGVGERDMVARGFYLLVFDAMACRRPVRHADGMGSLLRREAVCLLAGDAEDYYRWCGGLADGSILIADAAGNYYHATPDGGKELVARERPADGVAEKRGTAAAHLKEEKDSVRSAAPLSEHDDFAAAHRGQAHADDFAAAHRDQAHADDFPTAHRDQAHADDFATAHRDQAHADDFATAVSRLTAAAAGRVKAAAAAKRQAEDQARQSRLVRLRRAMPFRSGRRWGLRLDGRVVVPPLYRTLLPPVAGYCAVEVRPRQWGIIRVDGKVIVEPRYEKIEIRPDCTALLTTAAGKTKTVDLKECVFR